MVKRILTAQERVQIIKEHEVICQSDELVPLFTNINREDFDPGKLLISLIANAIGNGAEDEECDIMGNKEKRVYIELIEQLGAKVYIKELGTNGLEQDFNRKETYHAVHKMEEVAIELNDNHKLERRFVVNGVGLKINKNIHGNYNSAIVMIVDLTKNEEGQDCINVVSFNYDPNGCDGTVTSYTLISNRLLVERLNELLDKLGCNQKYYCLTEELTNLFDLNLIEKDKVKRDPVLIRSLIGNTSIFSNREAGCLEVFELEDKKFYYTHLGDKDIVANSLMAINDKEIVSKVKEELGLQLSTQLILFGSATEQNGYGLVICADDEMHLEGMFLILGANGKMSLEPIKREVFFGLDENVMYTVAYLIKEVMENGWYSLPEIEKRDEHSTAEFISLYTLSHARTFYKFLKKDIKK